MGNPFSHLPSTLAKYRVADRNEAIDRYAEWLEATIVDPDAFGHEAVTAAMRMISEESVLVCWCKPKKCHGDVIVRLWKKYFDANGKVQI